MTAITAHQNHSFIPGGREIRISRPKQNAGSILKGSVYRFITDEGRSEAADKLYTVFWRDFLAGSSSIPNYLAGRFELTDELNEIYKECSIIGWDGYEAAALSSRAYRDAFYFLSFLPNSIPKPSVVPEPDGDIGFEWNFGKNAVFVVSVDGTGIASYAGILGVASKVSGIEVLDDSIFEKIKSSLDRIFPK